MTKSSSLEPMILSSKMPWKTRRKNSVSLPDYGIFPALQGHKANPWGFFNPGKKKTGLPAELFRADRPG